MNNNQLPWQQQDIICHSQYLLRSFQHWTGRSLIDISGSTIEQAEGLFKANFVLVSHGTEADPIFNYANQIALELWQMTWNDFTRLPSRLSAEPVEQRERDRLLAETRNQGFSHYQGVRISRTGNRFFIKNGIIWNVLNEDNQICGQAAVFSDYTPV